MRKTITVLVLLALLAGLSYSAAQASDDDKLQKILQITSLPAEIEGLQARLDRGQFVYGLPTDVPDNDWKPSPGDAFGRDWQTANGIDLGHPGEEPRYLGYIWTGDDPFTNDWFPIDAPNEVPPAERDMIAYPWDKGYCNSFNSSSISDATWSIIKKTLARYHKRLGLSGSEGFANNPAFSGNFDAVKDYFKVLAEPRPGLTGAVRHWHYRADLGGVYYDTITVWWSKFPDFVAVSIDPGVPQGQQAQTGQTYTGKVVLSAKVDGSLLTDPMTLQLMDAAGEDKNLDEQYTVPFGVAVNGQWLPLQGVSQVPGLGNIYFVTFKRGVLQDTVEIPFQWTFNGGTATLTAVVNECLSPVPSVASGQSVLLPSGAWGYMEWSELTNTNNKLEVAVVGQQLPNLKVTSITLDPNPGQQGSLTSGTVTVVNESQQSFAQVPTKWVVRRPDGSTLAEGIIPADYGPGETKQLTLTFAPDCGGSHSVAAMVNPNGDNPPNEANFVSGDWPGDNRMEVSYWVKEPEEWEPTPGDRRLHLQAYSKAGEDIYGNWQPSVVREPFTAKWTDDVHATLTVGRPTPPRGTLVWWEISWARLTYPRVADDFCFGNPVPPEGWKTISMNVPGRVDCETEGGAEIRELQATAVFEEDWALDGFGVYNMATGEEMAVEPKNYEVSARFEVTYQYKYLVCDPDGGCYWEYATRSYTDMATAYLLVNGAGTVPY